MKHLTRAFDGQNQWWKYLVVLFIAFFAGQTIGAIPLVVAIIIQTVKSGGDFAQADNPMDLSAYGIDPNVGLALMVIPFIVTLITAVLLVKGFHHRNFNDVINGGRKFRWRRFWMGAGVWGAITLPVMLLGVAMDPDNYEFQFNAASFIPLVVVTLLFIPLQSGTEEYLFRGYLAQGVAGWTKRPWLVILIPSLLFALLHGVNPEVKEYGFWVMMPQYLSMGLAFAVLAILSDGIELVIGVHAVNNCLSSMVVTSKASALQTPALFLQKHVNPAAEFIPLLIGLVIMVGVFTLIYKWDFSVLLKKIKPTDDTGFKQEMEPIKD